MSLIIRRPIRLLGKTFEHFFQIEFLSKRFTPSLSWGGGGRPFYYHALEHPDDVDSVVFLDVATDNIEFDVEQEINGWSDEQMLEEREKTLKGRMGLFDVINGIGVPFGIMGIFVGP